MGLGFTVADLLPRARGGGRLAMGLSRIAPTEWLRPAPDLDRRRAAFAQDGSIALLPDAGSAVAELASLPGIDATGEPGAESPEALLRACGEGVWEDLCLLSADAQGNYRLVAAAVGFPTDWRLEEKMGLPLIAIHAPIHGYAEQLSDGVDRFMAGLAPGAIFGRANWFIVASDALRYLPQDDPGRRFAHVTAANAGETLFVRCERQTLRRLPASGAILFTIGIDVVPLGSLPPGHVAQLAASVAAISSGEHERRAAPFYAGALCGYAAGRVNDGDARGR